MADGLFFTNQNKVFDKLIKDLENATDELINMVDAEMGASIEQMATKAKQKAPAGPNGRLRSSIHPEKTGKLSYHLKADVNYAAYVEFGTGPRAKEYVPLLDADWQEYAKTFKKPKDGHTPEQPFFYPVIIKEFPEMIKKMQDLIKK